jgi:hypothetical protein
MKKILKKGGVFMKNTDTNRESLCEIVDLKVPKLKNTRSRKIITNNDYMKYEITSELGLIDKVIEKGWGGLTAKEAGRIGGIVTSKKRKMKKADEKISESKE